jgi:O-antigen/teichoic acid export membrane protein
VTETPTPNQIVVSEPSETLSAKLMSTFGAQIGLFAFGTAIQIVMARALGPAGKGLYSLTLLTAMTLVAIAHGSLSAANSHFAGRSPQDRPALVGNSFFLAFVWGAVVVAITYVVVFVIKPGFLPDLSRRFWMVALAAIVPLLLFEFSNGLVMGLDWMKRFSLVQVMKEAMVFVAAATLWIAGVLTVENALIVWLGSHIFVALLQAGSAWWRVGWKLALSFRLLKRVASFIFQAHVANVFSFLKLRADMFLIAYFLSLREVGYYSIAMAMLAALWYLPAAIAQVLIPHISKRDNQAGNQLTPRLARMGFAVSFIGAILMAILSYPLVKALFGDAFLPAIPALLLLLPGGVIFTFAKMLAGDLIGRGLPKYAMYISIAAFVTNIIVNLLLIPKFGIIGAAIASSITNTFTGLMFLTAFLRESHVSVWDTIIIKRSDMQGIARFLQRN